MRSLTIKLLSVRRSLPLFLAVVVCLAIWQVLLTWRMMQQDRNLAIQQSREHLEQVADLAMSQLASAMAEWELRLREIETLPPLDAVKRQLPPGGQLILLVSESVHNYPARPLLFVPEPPSGLQLSGSFDVAEKLEFRDRNYQRAIEALQPLTRKPATRAEALLRIGRLLRKINHQDKALAIYKELSTETSTNPDGVPYVLLAAGARVDMQPQSEVPEELRKALLEGRWPLHRETFEFYWKEVNRVEHSAKEPPDDSIGFSFLVARLFDEWQRSIRAGTPSSGRETLPDESLLMWHATPSRLTALSLPTVPLRAMVKLPANANDIRWKWQGQWNIGEGAGANPNDKARVVRSLGEAQLKGNIEFSSRSGVTGRGLNGPLWLTGVALMLSLVLTGAYAIYRGVSRELRVAQLQSDFVAAVSHEFRSPLTSLRGITELLSDGRIAEPSRLSQSYAFLERETGRLQRLVEDLLDFGRMESGKKQYKKEPHDAFGIVRAAEEQFQEEARAQGFDIEVNLAASTSTVHGDQEALTRAIRNLLENAVKYSQDSHTVWVEGRITQQQVAISVRDKGIGIAPEEHREIFQKFVRGTAAKTAGIKGTGIGLSMVRQIIQAAGGEIHLKSAPGTGSTFTILLPLAQNTGVNT